MDMNAFNFRSPQLVFTGLLMRVNMKTAGLDKSTGEALAEKAQLQLFCNIVSPDDSIRSEMVNLSLKDDTFFAAYQSLLGQVVSVPAGYMKVKDGVVFWAMKGYAPIVVSPGAAPVPSGSAGNASQQSVIKSPLDKAA